MNFLCMCCGGEKEDEKRATINLEHHSSQNSRGCTLKKYSRGRQACQLRKVKR